jgi:chitin-binding protein
VFDQNGTPVAHKLGPVGNNNPHFHVALENATPGTYDVTALATVNHEPKAQAQHRFTLLPADAGGDYDHVFPAGLGQYSAGTKVLQPKDNAVYECKPWPNTGYCNQWNANATAFEPGVGHAWQEAWIRK